MVLLGIVKRTTLPSGTPSARCSSGAALYGPLSSKMPSPSGPGSLALEEAPPPPVPELAAPPTPPPAMPPRPPSPAPPLARPAAPTDPALLPAAPPEPAAPPTELHGAGADAGGEQANVSEARHVSASD